MGDQSAISAGTGYMIELFAKGFRLELARADGTVKDLTPHFYPQAQCVTWSLTPDCSEIAITFKGCLVELRKGDFKGAHLHYYAPDHDTSLFVLRSYQFMRNSKKRWKYVLPLPPRSWLLEAQLTVTPTPDMLRALLT